MRICGYLIKGAWTDIVRLKDYGVANSSGMKIAYGLEK